MPLLEEVDEGMEGSSGGAEGLKAEHRRKRASKARKKKKRSEVRSVEFKRWPLLLPLVRGVGGSHSRRLLVCRHRHFAVGQTAL